MIGIYCIENKINGKKYIGQSWDIEHRCRRYGRNSHNEHIERSIRKYGKDNFKIECIREISNSPLTQIFLDIFESKYIKKYDTMNPNKGYNKRDGGAIGRMSEETKKRISKTMKGKPSLLIGYKQTKEHIENSRNSNIGRVPSEETKKKISLKLKGRVSPMKGRKQSEQHIRQRTERMIITKKLKMVTNVFNSIRLHPN